MVSVLRSGGPGRGRDRRARSTLCRAGRAPASGRDAQLWQNEPESLKDQVSVTLRDGFAGFARVPAVGAVPGATSRILGEPRHPVLVLGPRADAGLRSFITCLRRSASFWSGHRGRRRHPRGREHLPASEEHGARGMARRPARGRWTELLADAIDEYYADTGEIDTPLVHFEEWLAEWGRDAGGGQHGLLPLTAHRAKDLEFDHVVVLDGGWDRPGAANENGGEEAPEGAGTGGSRATPGDEIPRKALAAGASRPRAVRRPNPQPLTPKPPGITPTKRATAHGPCGFCPPRAAANPGIDSGVRKAPGRDFSSAEGCWSPPRRRPYSRFSPPQSVNSGEHPDFSVFLRESWPLRASMARNGFVQC